MAEPPKRPKRAPTTREVAQDVPQPAGSYVAIGFSADAEAVFQKLSVKERNGLNRKLGILAENPEGGKPLIRELQGYYRVTYGRIRAIACPAEGGALLVVYAVYVVALGLRREGSADDPYLIATEQLKRGDTDVRAALTRLMAARLNEQNLD